MLPSFPDLNEATTRVLAFGVGAAALATTAGLAGSDPGLEAVAAQGLSGLVGLAGSVVAADWHQKLASRVGRSEAVLRNHDLAQAVGEAIRRELGDQRGRPSPHSLWPGTASPREVALRG